MSRKLPPDGLSLTGAGAGLVTLRDGTIDPDEPTGLFVDDVRVLSSCRLRVAGYTAELVGHQRTGASTDRLVFTLSADGVIDPVATVQRDRAVSGRGMRESIVVTAHSTDLDAELRLTIERDDRTVYQEGGPAAPVRPVAAEGGGVRLDALEGGSPALIDAPGWTLNQRELVLRATPRRGQSMTTTVAVSVPSPTRGDRAVGAPPRWQLATEPADLADLVRRGRDDLDALTMPVDGRDVFGAGSPFFLALFGRDSLIAGMQAIVDGPDRLADTLDVLAAHQATTTDGTSRSAPGQILHELRLGRMGVFGVSPGVPYFGAVDTAPLFVVALGEAMRWGLARDRIARLVPHAIAALEWCRTTGDADGDGFIESVPHRSGLTNLHWKDSSDSIVDRHGVTVVGSVAVAEVQAYWYRALRTMAEICQHVGVGDETRWSDDADRLAERFADAFLFSGGRGPFVGLALDEDKRLLDVRASNVGHVLWSGILAREVAAPIAVQLRDRDLFSGWGVRTLSSAEPGFNPFGYHRGTVWPHDTAIALHGAARYGDGDTVAALAGGLIDLGVASHGELPELLSGLSREEMALPVPYPAACRPQAWAAGAPLAVLRALLGLEPDAPNGTVRIHPMLPSGVTVTARGVRVGDHELSIVASGTEVVDVDAPGLDVVTGPDAVLAVTGWCPM